jgi:transcriptional regulator of acetoin/glycerol metabolism
MELSRFSTIRPPRSRSIMQPYRRRSTTLPAGIPAPNVFFSTAPQRTGLARQRFFEEGVRPTGLVSDAVIQSWTRCAQSDRAVTESISFTPVTRSRIDSAVARNRLLLDAGREELQQLQTLLAGTGCKAILTDAQCVVVHSTPTERKDGALMWLAGRVGVDLSESCVGTTAPGMVALSGQGCTVLGAEHYFHANKGLQCAAAPIRDMHGELVAVLDLSCEGREFRFDAAALVHLHATAIENRVLARHARPHLLLRFQACAQLLHTPLEGLAAVDEAGRVMWLNAAGRGLLQAPHSVADQRPVEQAFGLRLATLMSAAQSGTLLLHRLPNGLQLCLQPQTEQRRVHAVALPKEAEQPPPAAPPADEAAKLRQASRLWLEKTLADCGGNVSRAARTLGVSRGLIYRHTKPASKAC